MASCGQFRWAVFAKLFFALIHRQMTINRRGAEPMDALYDVDEAQRQVREDEIHRAVRERYGKIAQDDGCGCGPSCGERQAATPSVISVALGYEPEDVETVPSGANMGLGCGNPQVIAGLAEGETVLDLGSGGGFDCFLAARRVGAAGRVIGVDMTAEMISKARANAASADYHNVDFRLGEIENLPVADNSVDCIISNCVINLSPNKPRVFSEAYRVLKPGGRIAVSDIVATVLAPEEMRENMELFTGCMAGASLVPEIEAMLAAEGFVAIRITPKSSSRTFISDWAPGTDVADYLVSANIEARKPELDVQGTNPHHP